MMFDLYQYLFIDLSAKKRRSEKKCGTHFLAIFKLPRTRAKNWVCKQGTEYFLTLQTRTANIPEKRYFPGKTVFLKMLFC